MQYLIALSALAACASAASAKYDVYLKTLGCHNLDSESEPYIYAGIDTSYLPGTTKYVETPPGKVSGTITTDISFAPQNVLYWASVPTPQKQTLETYIYGKDKFRPDSDLGDIDLSMKKVPYDCTPTAFLDKTVDSDIFSRNAYCDFEIAICPPGTAPMDKATGKSWKTEVGPKGAYTKGF